jgi:hypothetical protein
MDFVAKVVSCLQKELGGFPKGFYSSFDYTRTGQNFTHPFTLGVLAKAL